MYEVNWINKDNTLVRNKEASRNARLIDEAYKEVLAERERRSKNHFVAMKWRGKWASNERNDSNLTSYASEYYLES